jgi:hypothetical protein
MRLFEALLQRIALRKHAIHRYRETTSICLKVWRGFPNDRMGGNSAVGERTGGRRGFVLMIALFSIVERLSFLLEHSQCVIFFGDYVATVRQTPGLVNWRIRQSRRPLLQAINTGN